MNLGERFFLGDEVISRDLEFTGDAGLAEAARRRRIGEIFQSLCPKRVRFNIRPAFILVMAPFRDGTGRASRHAFSTLFISEKKTVFLVMAIGPLSGRYFQKCDDATHPDGDTFR